MTESGRGAGTATPEELRGLFLFEDLDEEKLAWLSVCGAVEELPADGVICAQGEPAEFLYVLLDGEMVMSQNVRGHIVEINRTSRAGTYGGAVQAYLDDQIEQKYQHTLRATRPSRIFVLPARKFGKAVRKWFPMATHLLAGIFFGMSNLRRTVDQRERLAALGTITAGLTHELNNPAAAAARASAELGDRLLGAQRSLADLAARGVDCTHLGALVSLRPALPGAPAGRRSPLEVSDAEDELGDWLEEHDVPDAWELAPGLVAAGVGIEQAEQVAEAAGAHLPAAVRWLAEVLEVAQLQAEISEATGRITALLDSARQYSQLDRAAYQRADLRELIESTLTMLRRKIGPDVAVKTDFDADLPPVPVYAAELNQVWTNLIVNALYAMGGEGTLTVRTARENDHALVEIGDTGVGIPEENLTRIFTPFFTTKPVGQGTGLGLDISWRIVADRHGGDIRVESLPGDTRFQVLLPLTEPDLPDQ
ncbi:MULTISPECIES: ATP-binding protein [Actinomadura]|uniref:histidine kinase n=1 Tax=Actinomadura litoris TaxID=2678616 RepID=A0A7K1LAA9_9ACTN|nr:MULTISPECIES: ATP-binding protein [Actinomadura]MBT2213244.1 cyclic nucleotide-binding domain-containing protein [Actinomadura sp. NEAU-AAG7]MUN41354.1 cyclic nucleotide-binding domain-containing protein [Actinomadura litoris]